MSTERSDCAFSKRFQSLKLCVRCIHLYVTHLTTLFEPKIFRSSLILNELDSALLVKANSISIKRYSCVALMGIGDITV